MARHKRAAERQNAWLVFEDESGQGLRPPKGRTWGRRGRTPVVTVTGGHNSRVSLAALIALKQGERPRLVYRVHRGLPGDRRKGFTETDYARLLDAAHQQLGGPLVLVWDNLNTHVSKAMRELVAARDWLTVFQLPAYASELNPVESVWSHLKRSLANLANQARHHPAHRAGQDTTAADAVPGRAHRRFPHRNQARPHAPPVTPTIEDR